MLENKNMQKDLSSLKTEIDRLIGMIDQRDEEIK